MIETEAVPSQQLEMPIALVQGQPVTTLPQDLYIPPDALEVILEAFQGPLDLLLYLIRRQNLDILNIPIADITHQYMEYVELMKELHLELAAEYLVMAALLAEIKSRMLLPRPANVSEEEEDPRAELVRRLQEYEQLKKAAEDLDQLPQIGRDVFMVKARPPDMRLERPLPVVTLDEIYKAIKEVIQRADMYSRHAIVREPLSIRERMSQVLTAVSSHKFCDFVSLFTIEEGRMGVVVTFIAILELIKQSLIEIIQAEPFSAIHVKAVSK